MQKNSVCNQLYNERTTKKLENNKFYFITKILIIILVIFISQNSTQIQEMNILTSILTLLVIGGTLLTLLRFIFVKYFI